MEGIKDSIDKINESLQALTEAFNNVSKGIDDIVKSQAVAPIAVKPATRKATPLKEKATAGRNGIKK